MTENIIAENNHFIPKISVIISVYNVEKYLRQCLDSVVNQTLKEMEIICVNDGSPDGSLEILKEYAEKDKRIITINQENEGAGAARNAGLDAAKGEYLYFLDGDDWIELHAMGTLYNRAAPDDLDILKFDRFNYNDATGERQPYIYCDGRQLPNVFSAKSVPAIYVIASSTAWNKLYKRSFIKEKNIRFQNLKTCNDIYFAFMAIASADRVSVVNEPLVTWRSNHTQSITASRGSHWECIFAAYDSLRNDLNDRFIKSPELEESFDEKMACHFSVEYYYAVEKDKFMNTAKQILSEKCLLKFNEIISENVVILQELEVIEKFLIESPEEEIKEAANYIVERVKLNFERMQNTIAAVLAPRFLAVFNRVKGYLEQPQPAINRPTQEQIRQFFDNKKQETLAKIALIKPLEDRNSPKYIVSLTSYGKRLADTAPYAIITLFNQSVKPDKIILWVAHNDKENVPAVLKQLTEKGLEIRFCEDLKSYKKLIPALLEFPEDYIITADDDVYYPQNWLEQLIFEHSKNPKKIICHRAHGIKVDENHNPISYNNWDFCIEPGLYFSNVYASSEKSAPRHLLESVFPTGVGGALYPPYCFYKEITNKKLFTRLAPNADDIWFWAMAVINKEYFGKESPYIVVRDGYSQNLQNIEPEQTQGGNALWNYNSQGGNDEQLKAVIEHFPQIGKVLGKIAPFQSTNKEHFTPNEIKNVYEEVLYLIHIFAYFLDCEYIKNNNCLKILDYACGDGYGSYFIANSYPQSEVVGADIDNDALVIADSKYNLTNLQFKHIAEIKGKFDFICAHQIIEHVDDVNYFLNTLKNLLNPGGAIIISTPQREYRLNDNQAPWSFGHKREYTKTEFENDVKKVFPHAQIYQMSGDEDLLLVEYNRCSMSREDRKIYGGRIPMQFQLNRTYSLEDLFLQSETTNDSINLFAIISPDNHFKSTIYIAEPSRNGLIDFNSADYWEKRYATGGNSGAGSYNRLAQFKAEILNDFVKKYSVNSIIEFGCGDGNQLSLAQYPQYMGFDVSQTAINICKNKFERDETKEFRLVNTFNDEKAEATLSLDVIYHLIEDDVFENYMKTLFCASTKYVIIYASNKASEYRALHVKHRKFTDWIESNKKDWALLQFIPNKHSSKNDSGDDTDTSFADFYIFGNKSVVENDTVKTLENDKHKTKRFCPLCQRTSTYFARFGLIPRRDALCPHCWSLERHRLVCLFLKEKTDFFTRKSRKILHIAPEFCMEMLFKNHIKEEEYISADLYNPRAKVKMDIMDIRYKDESFDIIFCSHVLEHVSDDRKAIREFFRVLTKGGWAILNVPIIREKTYEDPTITDPKAREKAYGQNDHVRAYGIDYVDRLQEAGFLVEVTGAKDFLDSFDIEKMGLGNGAAGEVYFCVKR
ncbi:MAG: glycosyltransferase [Acidobacteriota bacterium]|jgi:glycosyltransferase involved in cell wall biosynthesis/predicted SAM-dependent methyltransferase|nr:glycosyltransferase [Acidobacteriota bacterium]